MIIPADQVFQQILHTETDADRERATQKGKGLERDFYQDQTEHNEYAEENTQRPFREDPGRLFRNLEPVRGDPLNENGQEAAEQVPDHQDQHDLNHFSHSNAAATSDLLAIHLDRIDSVVQLEIPEPVKEILCVAGSQLEPVKPREMLLSVGNSVGPPGDQTIEPSYVVDYSVNGVKTFSE
ncbi:MAG: hypothetical protein JO313_15955 [Verrucomicrobia bacterium]|nr:hypothetical protein [Verrucomicrobiota bacterium]